MRIVAGCDGGGTKCHVRVCVVNRKGELIRTGESVSGPANVKSSPAGALKNIQAAMARAKRAAAVLPDAKIDQFVAALAGAGDAAAQNSWQATLTDSLPVRHVHVVPDVSILFAAANIPSNDAALATIVGTGSIAWARNRDGSISRAGGRGPQAGDEGSGLWIASEAMRRLEASSTTPKRFRNLQRQLAGSDHRDTRIAGIAKDIFELASTDETAQSIVETAAWHITKLITAATGDFHTTLDSPLRWVCAGGVAVNQPAWLHTILTNCNQKQVFLQPPITIPTPVDGAIKMAIER